MDKVGGAVSDRFIKFRQFLRINAEVAVEDHEQIALGHLKAMSDRVSFAAALLNNELNIPMRVGRDNALDLLTRSVIRASLDKDDFGFMANVRNAGHGGFY